MKKIYLIIALLLLAAGNINATIRYVRVGATGSGTTSWANATPSFVDGVTGANSGDSVFVSAGVYQPQYGYTFAMKEGVKIFGGFAPTGNPTFAQRDLTSYYDTLKGNNSIVISSTGPLTNAAVLDGFTITNGVTNGNGAGMNSAGSAPTIRNCTFYNNNAVGNGGAIYFSSGVTPIVSNCAFINNSAGGSGGAIMVGNSASPNIGYCTFINNTAQVGGGVAINGGSNVPIYYTTFSNNSAISAGGGIDIQNVSGNVTLSTITMNDNKVGNLSTNGYGGAIDIMNTQVFIYYSNFNTNKSNYSGGAIHSQSNSSLTIGGCKFTNDSAVNSTTTIGGAISNGASLAITSSAFSGNYTNGVGAVAYLSGTANDIDYCKFVGNTALSAGIFYVDGTSFSPNVSAKSCLFSGNLTGSSHFYFNGNNGSLSFTGCTISGNNTTNGIATVLESAIPVQFKNCIIWGNAGGATFGGSAPTFNNSILESNTTGVGNSTANPLFVNPVDASTAPTTDGNYQLKPCSPAINAGDNTGIGAFDVDMNSRLYGGTVDIGAYEFQAAPTNITATISSSNVNCNVGNNATATVTPAGGTAPYTYSWAPSGGTAATAAELTPGTYICTITDANGCTYDADPVIVSEAPVADAGADITVVYGASTTIGAALPLSSSITLQLAAATTSTSGFMDEVSWTITDVWSNVVASGGPYIGYDFSEGNPPIQVSLTLNPANGPFTFNIETEGDYGDNDVNYDFLCGSTTVQSGTFMGSTTNSVSSITPCPSTASWLPATGLNDASIAQPTATPTQTTGYQLTVTTPDGCTATDSVYVNVIVPDTTLIESICEGTIYVFGSQTLTATGTYFDTVTTSSGDSIIMLNLMVTPLTLPTGNTTASGNLDALTYTTFTSNNCELLVGITSVLDLGNVTVTTTALNSAQTYNNEPYIGRYYDIETDNDGPYNKVTLFYSQQDFDDYNNLVGADNPLYPQIGVNGENLKITAFHSEPGSGTGPGGYNNDSSLKEAITPNVITWNSVAMRWEVIFLVDSFSGFFAHTNAIGNALPIRLQDIAAINLGTTNQVDWTSAEEDHGGIFEIERSKDTRSFIKIGTVDAKGIAGSKYSFADGQPFDGINYYRLHLHNNDGSATYSKVVNATMKNAFSVEAYPNPVSEVLTVKIMGNIAGNGEVVLTDISGRILGKATFTASKTATFTTNNLTQGTYFVKYRDDENSKLLKVVKK